MSKKIDCLLIILLLASLIKGIIWAVSFPAFQGPDEPAYFSYAQYLAENKRVPHNNFEEEGIGGSEQFENILRKLEVENIKFNDLNQSRFSSGRTSLSGDEEELLKGNLGSTKPKKWYAGYSYQPLYAFLNLPFYFFFRNNPLAQIYAMRLFSVMLSSLTMLFAYLTGKKMFNDQKKALTLTVLIGFLPMFSHISSLIHIDNLMNLGFAGFFYYAVKFLKQNENLKIKDWLILLFWSGISFYTKLQGYIIFPFLAIFLVLKFQKKIFQWVNLLIFLLSIAGTAFYAKKLFIAQLIGIFSTIKTLVQEHNFVWFVKNIVLTSFIRPIYFSFWAKFGWVDTLISKPYYAIIGIILIMAISGFLIYLRKNLKGYGWRLISIDDLFFILAIIILTIVYFFISMAQFTDKSGLLEFSQGRYYFLAIIPIFGLLLKSWLNLIPDKYHNFWLFSLSFLMIFFNFICLAQYILPRYYG